jgi:hypothetical protein
MGDELDRVLALKASAKSARDDGDWQSALDDLEDAESILENQLVRSSTQVQGSLAAGLADTYGMVGGIHRRWGLTLEGEERQQHLESSLEAYDRGFGYEKTLEPGRASTYNRVNRLVGRVLLSPSVLTEDADMHSDLREAARILAEETRTGRQKDPWAYCDRGYIELLLGAPDALDTLRMLDRLRAPRFVFDSALATLVPLSEVASEVRPELAQAVTQLQRSARRAE